jgi:YidC/Oxa1 family membrane protein insertase
MLTVVVRLILFPLTAKQAKSMIAMQRAQPEMKKIQEKYKNDRQKLNEELMKFYKENQINPLGGCLPLLAQMPVFIALYQTLRNIQDFIPETGRFSQMYQDICQNSACTKVSLDFFGMDLTLSASQAPKGFWNALPYFVLVALVVVSAFLQQRQTMRNQTTANPQMQIIGKVMPVVFGFISINIPAGVVLYFFTSNLWQIGQQEVVYRTIGTAAGPPPKKGAIEAKSTDKTDKGAEAPPAEATGTGGVKGLFKSLTPGAAAEEAPSGNGKPAVPSAEPKGSGSAAKKQQGAKPGAGGKQGTSGAKQGGSGGSRSGGSQNRRRNARKRKR